MILSNLKSVVTKGAYYVVIYISCIYFYHFFNKEIGFILTSLFFSIVIFK